MRSFETTYACARGNMRAHTLDVKPHSCGISILGTIVLTTGKFWDSLEIPSVQVINFLSKKHMTTSKTTFCNRYDLSICIYTFILHYVCCTIICLSVFVQMKFVRSEVSFNYHENSSTRKVQRLKRKKTRVKCKRFFTHFTLRCVNWYQKYSFRKVFRTLWNIYSNEE